MASTKRPVVIAFLSSLVWWVFFTISTGVVAPFVLLFAPFSTMLAYQTALLWSRFNIWSLGVICGLRYQVEGREKVPFFGWALWSVRPISVNRSSKVSSLEQVVAQATKRMAKGMSVMIFPEGTRVKAGTKGRYKTGASLMAERTRKPVLPIAHNAGHFWPRTGFIKNAGMITVRIGKLIDTTTMSAEDINTAVETWIEAQQAELDPDAVKQLSDD